MDSGTWERFARTHLNPLNSQAQHCPATHVRPAEIAEVGAAPRIDESPLLTASEGHLGADERTRR